MDVVVVTLQHKTLPRALFYASKVIPSPHFVLITERGNIGFLRNKGLKKATSPIVCILDDDIELNQNWLRAARAVQTYPTCS
jgi:glycosyltransferase involved in cell wall biosynthesis